MLLPCFLIGRCYCHVADVVATNCVLLIWQMLLPSSWCCYHYYVVLFLADVFACRQMELPTMGVDGRWNSHWVNTLVLILMFRVGPHPICEADGTCLCFYLGMGH